MFMLCFLSVQDVRSCTIVVVSIVRCFFFFVSYALLFKHKLFAIQHYELIHNSITRLECEYCSDLTLAGHVLICVAC